MCHTTNTQSSIFNKFIWTHIHNMQKFANVSIHVYIELFPTTSPLFSDGFSVVSHFSESLWYQLMSTCMYNPKYRVKSIILSPPSPPTPPSGWDSVTNSTLTITHYNNTPPYDWHHLQLLCDPLQLWYIPSKTSTTYKTSTSTSSKHTVKTTINTYTHRPYLWIVCHIGTRDAIWGGYA